MALKFKKSHIGCAALLLLALAVPGLLSLREDRPQDTGSSGVSESAEDQPVSPAETAFGPPWKSRRGILPPGSWPGFSGCIFRTLAAPSTPNRRRRVPLRTLTVWMMIPSSLISL